MDERHFPLKYEDVVNKWRSNLSQVYDLCEVGCGRKKRYGYIFCSEHFEAWGSVEDAGQKWMDAQRRNYLCVGQQALWREWT